MNFLPDKVVTVLEDTGVASKTTEPASSPPQFIGRLPSGQEVSLKKCTKCMTDRPLTDFYHKGKKENGKLMSECKFCFNSRMMKRFEEKSRFIVNLKGGKCLLCGYDKCTAALEFHHLDPSKKEFQINKRWSMSDESILKEIDKCVLLCSNCHREVHWKQDRGEVIEWSLTQ